MTGRRGWIFALTLSLVSAAGAQTVVDVTGVGQEKTSVSIDVTGAGSAAYAATLRRNLELTGCFAVKPTGSVKVTGAVGGSVTATGRGKTLTMPTVATDERAVRMAARRMSDAICEAMSEKGQKGFACDRLIFVSRKTPQTSELAHVLSGRTGRARAHA